MQLTGPTVIEIGSGAAAAPRPDAASLIWAAPGSLFVDRVASAWQRRGALDDLAHITGPWAVLLWDPAAREHLVVVDPIGVQPVFWARTAAGGFVISSHLASLVDRPDVDDTIDYESVLLNSMMGMHAEQILHRTRFEAVSKVPWGRALRIAPDGRTRTEQYFDPSRLAGPDRSITLADASMLLRERIDTAIARLLPEPGTAVGAHVSGGLDCSSLACRGNQLLRERGESLVAGYSWAPDERRVPRFEGDERSLLDDVSAQEGIDVHTVIEDESGDWFWELDRNRYPQSTHVFETYTLPRARADGVRTMLSGWGGDELASFNGRNVVWSLARRGRVDAVWSNVTGRLAIHSTDPVPLRKKIRAVGGHLFMATPEWIHNLRRPADARRSRAEEAEIDSILREVSPLAADIRRERNRTFAQARDHHDYQMALLTGGHIQHRTTWWYQTGQLFDIDYRYPLLDLDVVAAALTLPWWAYKFNGWGRVAYRMAVDPWVPASIAWNITKYEPSRFAPPVVVSDDTSQPRQARRTSAVDERESEMMAVARRASAVGTRTPHAPALVRARRDAAPGLT